MKKILILSLLISCSQFFMSCENWFDVNPKSQVKNDILFENENGYKTALFGIYTTMATPALYGQELTMSLLDVLAQYYTINDNYHNFYNASIYNYEASTVKSKFDAIWKTMYKTIMNCNNLLENMEGRQELFSGHNYELIRGETLGLRAYLHFDLLRMFAPSFTVGANAAAIPYVDLVTRTPFPQLTNMAVTEKILQDCEEALSLLEVSDPFGPAADNTEPEDEFLRNREERMNYYAVKALMARVYLWAGQTPKAGNIANELIAHPLLGTNRILFRLYSDKIPTMSDDYFTANSENNSQLSLSQNQRKEFYETEKYESSDKRIPSWLILNPNTIESDANTGRYFVSKYNQNGPMNQGIPLLRMTEIQYICAECQSEPAKGLDYLNTVRHEYGIPAAFDLTKENCVFEEELFKEYRKSFLAEGQLFFFLKRKDYTDIPGALNIENPRKIFCFPLPDDEKEFGNLITK